MYRKGKQHEPYTAKAQREGYPARSVYKLQEIDRKARLFGKGDKVLDLGAAPGSWLLYIAKQVGPRGFVLGVDTAPLSIELPRNAEFLQQNVMDIGAKDVLQYMGRPDAVVSDMAPATSGMRGVDAERSLELCFQALALAQEVVGEKGVFVCKALEGEGFGEFMRQVKSVFSQASRMRLKATIKESRELYVVARGFKNSALK